MVTHRSKLGRSAQLEELRISFANHSMEISKMKKFLQVQKKINQRNERFQMLLLRVGRSEARQNLIVVCGEMWKSAFGLQEDPRDRLYNIAHGLQEDPRDLRMLSKRCIENRNRYADTGLLISLDEGIEECKHVFDIYPEFKVDHPDEWYSVCSYALMKSRNYFFLVSLIQENALIFLQVCTIYLSWALHE